MDVNDFRKLIDKYLTGECRAEDIRLIGELLQKEQYMGWLDKIMEEQLMNNKSFSNDFPEVVDRVKRHVTEKISLEENNSNIRHLFFTWRRVAAAVLVLVVTSVVVWMMQKSGKNDDKQSQVLSEAAIVPGKDGAILTLDNGSQVVLDSLGNGVVATQSGAKIILKNGQVIYNNNAAENGLPVYNTITTPKGRQFRLLLEDGTQVWLNAASSIRYPVVFSGAERKVEVTGEVYFEVAKNAQKPFRVKINDEMHVEVLGTHFNISSYQNEGSVRTTLLEGSVQMISGKDKAILKPGQQGRATLQENNGAVQKIKILNDVNIEKVMAWKNGLFDFQDASLEEVMGQLERWYNIEVVYEKGIPAFEFIGKMGRDLSLDEVLRGLEVSEVHFRIEGRKVIVMP